MASRNDIVLDLREGYRPEEIAIRRQANLIWIEIIAGKRIPDCADIRREQRLKRLRRQAEPIEQRLAA